MDFNSERRSWITETLFYSVLFACLALCSINRHFNFPKILRWNKDKSDSFNWNEAFIYVVRGVIPNNSSCLYV